MEGTVLRIERASIHDGPGLRTVVFLKGCPLRCQWCSTPESQAFGPERGLVAEKCSGCGACVARCPKAALTVEAGRAVHHAHRCTGCMACVAACPNGAIVPYGRGMTAQAVAREIEKDEIFFFHSGGGVTLSGGEPLAQPAFAAEILERSQAMGINTAVETTLFAPLEAVWQVLPWVDHLYVDLKHMSPAEHKRRVGEDNGRVLENLRAVAASGYRGRVTVRVPFIPTVNDSEDNLRQTALLCREIGQLAQLELLPYHRLGLETYRRLGRAYPLSHIRSPSRAEVQARIDALARQVPQVDIVLAK